MKKIPARLYRCMLCKRTYKRNSNKVWIKSFCERNGCESRLYRVNKL